MSRGGESQELGVAGRQTAGSSALRSRPSPLIFRDACFAFITPHRTARNTRHATRATQRSPLIPHPASRIPPLVTRHLSPVIPHAFTLIELLVVIAIITVLASMIFPTLARSKASAHRIRCASNLHQLSLAAHMYWDDNSNSFFPVRGVDTNGWQTWWCGWLQSSGSEGARQFDATQGALYPYLKGRGVEMCPAFSSTSPQFKLKATGASYGYGYNACLPAPANRPPITTSRIQQPSGIILFADSAQVNNFQAPASPENPLLEEWYYLDNPTNYPSSNYYPHGHFRHSQKANTAFCDGHIASEKFVPGSIDPKLPNQFVGRFRPEILLLP